MNSCCNMSKEESIELGEYPQPKTKPIQKQPKSWHPNTAKSSVQSRSLLPSKVAVLPSRVKEEEVGEIIRLKSENEELRQRIESLETTLQEKEVNMERDIKMVLEKITKLEVLEAEKNRLQAQSKEKDVYIANLKVENDELHRYIIQQQKSAGSTSTEFLQMRKQQKERLSVVCREPKYAAGDQPMREKQKRPTMLSPMKEMIVQYGGQHDQLQKEYNELITNPNVPSILGQLEEALVDSFDAKVVLTKISMVAYEECKRAVVQSVTQHIEQLFTVQSDPDEESFEPSGVDMEDLSRAYGLLLQATGLKSHPPCSKAMQGICEKIRSEVKKLEQVQNNSVKRKMKKWPLEKVVELTWKFVTQNNPMILHQPLTFKEDIHERECIHWNPELHKPYTLIYARPVLNRCYNGRVVSMGLVGNHPPKESTV